MKAFIIALTLLSIAQAFSTTEGPNALDDRETRWQGLSKLIEEEISSINMVKSNMGPDLRFRLFELYCEKLALIKEKENIAFLRASVAQRMKDNKKTFFIESLAFYKKTKEYGLDIIKKYPRYQYNGTIFYGLALNSRDYGSDKKAEEFFLRALKIIPGHTPEAHNAQVSLSEFYYNEKKYSKALKYYSKVLENHNDKWRPKHLYNTAWCLLKEKRFEQAVQYLQQAYFLGHQPQMIAVEEQILDALATFFVIAGKIPQGINFFANELISNDNSRAPKVHYLLKLAHSSADKGHFKQTLDIFKTAMSIAVADNNHTDKVKIRLKELEVYRNYKKEDLFYKAAIEIDKLAKQTALLPEHTEEAIEKIKGSVGFIQLELAKRYKNATIEIQNARLKIISGHFIILSHIDPENKALYLYYVGESFYSISRYDDAIRHYFKAIKFIKEREQVIMAQQSSEKRKGNDDREALKKIFNSLFSAIEAGPFNKEKKNGYVQNSYEQYLTFYQNDSKARSIYQELFSLYLYKKEINKAFELNKMYIENFKQDKEKQKEQFMAGLDFYISRKDADSINKKIIIMKTPLLTFKKSEIEQTTEVMGKILFEKYQQMDASGKQQEAISGYQSLYASENYPASIKAKSAFNASIIALESADSKTAYIWQERAWSQMSDAERKVFLPKYIDFLLTHLTLLNPIDAQKTADLLQKQVCSADIKTYRKFMHNRTVLWLALEEYEKIKQVLTGQGQCYFDIEIQSELVKLYFERIENFGLWQELAFFHQLILGSYPKFKERFYTLLLKRFESILWSEDQQELDIFKQRFQGIITAAEDTTKNEQLKKIHEDLQTLETYSKLKEEEEIYFKIQIPSGSEFNEKLTNLKIMKGLKSIQELTTKAEAILKMAHPYFTPKIYTLLIDIYTHQSRQLLAIKAPNMPIDYQKGMRSQMQAISTKLMKKNTTYIISLKTIHEKSKGDRDFHKMAKYLYGDLLVRPPRIPSSFYLTPNDRGTL